jgi:ABC-type sugar transport system ATPase subunit
MPAESANYVLLRLTDVNKSFGAHQVLHDIDLEVRSGEVVVLLGAWVSNGQAVGGRDRWDRSRRQPL